MSTQETTEGGTLPELKPCPFCGNATKVLHFDVARAEIGCSHCVFTFVRWLGYESKDAAVEAWNARPIEDALTRDRDAAIALLREVEWSGKDCTVHGDAYATHAPVCPICDGDREGYYSGHKPDCRLAAIISTHQIPAHDGGGGKGVSRLFGWSYPPGCDGAPGDDEPPPRPKCQCGAFLRDEYDGHKTVTYKHHPFSDDPNAEPFTITANFRICRKCGIENLDY